jgi:anti-sigma regulatory factor (Ser/Thr protein kinase)
MVRGDLTRLVQILGNLLNNAAKYTNDGGRIHLSVRRDGQSVEFRVKDNGIGIAPDSQSKLFNLFSRLETTDDRTPGGLGIGLALVRKLVEMHSGEVAVRSSGVGQGSEFVVRMPLLDSIPAAADRAIRAAASTQPRHRILVADDNPDALESLALLLECDGHEVWKAANGAEAFELARSFSRTSRCWISACRSWTATRPLAAFAPRPGARR